MIRGASEEEAIGCGPTLYAGDETECGQAL